jgi:hypothetical protein
LNKEHNDDESKESFDGDDCGSREQRGKGGHRGEVREREGEGERRGMETTKTKEVAGNGG